MGYDRIQRVMWSDIQMAQKNSDDFTFEAAKIIGPSSLEARPAIYEVTLRKTADATAEETLIIGGTTFTAKASTPMRMGRSRPPLRRKPQQNPRPRAPTSFEAQASTRKRNEEATPG